jgi:branched-chain amino acid transport system ATP-binding protein
MLEVSGITAGYQGGNVIHDVDFHVGAGEAVMIIGSNGAGKTTLFRAVLGLLRPSAGSVRFEGRSIDGLATQRIARMGISFVPAERHLFPRMTAQENLALGAYPGRPDQGTLQSVFDLFPRLAERQGQRAGTMSGGEQQMLAVGRALMSRPRLLILDEPTTGLAPKLAAEAYQALGVLRRRGLTVLVAEQQVPLAMAFSDRGYVLENGAITKAGDRGRAGRRPRRPPGLPGGGVTANLLDGIVLGLQFGLLAAGLTLVYGLGGVLNLAYGQMAVISAMTVVLTMEAGVPTLPAIAIGLATGGLLGLILDLTLLRPVYRRHGEARVLLSLLLTLGLALMVDGFLSWKYPTKALTLRIGGGPIDILGVPMVRGGVVASVITLVVLASLFLFFRRTTLGRAVRSVIEDEEGARLVGIDPQRMLRFILVLTGVLAALVAVTRSLVVPVSTSAGFELTVWALVVTVVGGLGSVSGGLLAGIVLGIISTVAASTVGTVLSLVILLVAAAVTILIKPSGLLGVRE